MKFHKFVSISKHLRFKYKHHVHAINGKRHEFGRFHHPHNKQKEDVINILHSNLFTPIEMKIFNDKNDDCRKREHQDLVLKVFIISYLVTIVLQVVLKQTLYYKIVKYIVKHQSYLLL